MSDHPTPEPLSAFEESLISLKPSLARFNRDQVLFQAGRASARSSAGRWKWATGIMGAIAAACATLVFFRPPPEHAGAPPEPRVVYITVEKETPAPVAARTTPMPPESAEAESKAMANLRMRDQVFLMGVDTLPTMAAKSDEEKPSALDPLLGLPATILDSPGRNILHGIIR